MRKLISIITAVFNEQATIPILYERLQKALEPCRSRYDFEFIFTNNSSSDNTPEIVAKLREKDPSVQLITLSRNFGYQASLQAGLTYAAGDAMVVIDADCEDPPEMIPQFLEHWEKGYEVVYGIRQDRPEWWPIKKLRSVFYYVLKASADMDIVLFMAEFSLMTSEVRDAIVYNNNSRPFLRSEIGYAGFRRKGIPYRRQPRVAGETHYNLLGMAAFAIAGILTSSTFLLRAAAYVLPLVFLINGVALWWDTRIGEGRAFYACVAFDLLYIIALMSVFGLYIARIYKNSMQRPNYIVSKNASLMNREFPIIRPPFIQS